MGGLLGGCFCGTGLMVLWQGTDLHFGSAGKDRGGMSTKWVDVQGM